MALQNSQDLPDSTSPNLGLPILYQDDAILVINKPAGLLSIPDGYNPALPYVAGLLQPEFGKCWIVHRLDRETSGIMVLARTPGAHRELNIQFEHRLVQKTYHAWIQGHPEWDFTRSDAPLRVNGDRRHRTVVAPLTGKAAQTDFRLLDKYAWGCLVEARPHTGYTHQIRAHLAALGFPILGDDLYRAVGSNKKAASIPGQDPPSVQRLALHAYEIQFTHPVTGLAVNFTAPHPPDLQQLA